MASGASVAKANNREPPTKARPVKRPYEVVRKRLSTSSHDTVSKAEVAPPRKLVIHTTSKGT